MTEESTTADLEELVRRVIQATNSGDFDDLMTLYKPNAVWDASPMGIGTFEGPDAIRGFFEDWWGLYQEYELKLEEFRDLGSGVTIAVFSQRGRLPDSSGWVQIRHAAVSTWADGLVG